MNKRDELKLKIQEWEKDQKELNKLKQNIEFQKYFTYYICINIILGLHKLHFYII